MNEATVEAQPKTGPQSPKGPRWFVTMFPELSVTMQPQDIKIGDGGRERPVKARRILFNKDYIPKKLLGLGYMTSSDKHLGSLNSLPFWGVRHVTDQEEIDFLRTIDLYKNTPQDNTLTRNMKLKELSWDPSNLERATNLLISQPTIGEEEAEEGIKAPAEYRELPEKAKTGLRR